MDAVIKVGGSLSLKPNNLKALGSLLSSIAKDYKITVVPGGGKFADAVRELDTKFHLQAAIAHRMAILAMDQYGLLLSQVIPGCRVYDSIEEVSNLSALGSVSIFLPSKILSQGDPFAPSWDVTSDSIAAYVAFRLKAIKAVFVTDVDGIFTEDPRKNKDAKLVHTVSVNELLRNKKRTSVDKFLPVFLSENPLDCYVVNGNYPERLKLILLNRQTLCTRIVI